MTAHELLCQTNWDLIRGQSFSDQERAEIASKLLTSAATHNEGQPMYPIFYKPAERLITINGVMPKTKIFSANHYELEILRILALWRRDDSAVERMLQETRDRLSKACFGRFCPKGECFEASIVALRFLAAAFPNEEQWITTLIEGIRNEIDNKPKGKRRHSGTTFYYWLTLTDIDLPIAVSEIRRYEPVFVQRLRTSCSYQNAYDKVYNPIAMYIVRNCLARLPEYRHIKDIEGYAGSDGRFRFDLP